MKNVEKDVVLEEKERKEKFRNLLEKICKDFNADNYREKVQKFIEGQEKSK